MRLGVVSAILGSMDFFEAVDCVSSLGYTCMEAACWPGEKADRRYAGVQHINVRALDKAAAKRISSYCTDRNVAISALAFYPNTMGDRPELVKRHIEHLKFVMDAAALLEVETVATFVGRDPRKTVEENLDRFSEVWQPLVEYARTRGIRIAIENCPMLFSRDEWPGGKNLAFSPAVWRKMFERLPAENFGLDYDPSHFIWQQMDYISPLYEFREKIFHVHCKDIRLDQSLSLSVEQASYVDGCSRLQSIFYVMLPCSLSGLISIVIYSFISSWLSYLIPYAIIMNADLASIRRPFWPTKGNSVRTIRN